MSSVRKEVSDDDWGFVIFPTDFNTNRESGTYSWCCVVNDKSVAGGKFEFKSDQVKVMHQIEGR